MQHIVLAGDSIFDNQSYVNIGEPDVITQLTEKLKGKAICTLLAIDGDITSGVVEQLTHLPKDATDLIISVGGNDGLGAMQIFDVPVKTIGNALLRIHSLRKEFEQDYTLMVKQALQTGLSVTLCTIYYPQFHAQALDRVNSFTTNSDGEAIQASVMSALAVYNDVILKIAAENHLDVIDLRTICNEVTDFANPIEPSMIGGNKITEVITQKFTKKGGKSSRMCLY